MLNQGRLTDGEEAQCSCPPQWRSLFLLKGNYYFQYKEEVVKTGHCEEVNGTEPSP
jgi:hypothetical protein